MELDGDQTNAIPICNFKSNKLSHIDKKHREEQVNQIRTQGMDEPGSPYKFEAIRLPNKIIYNQGDS